MTQPSFNARVYALVQRIPPGRVLTYGRVAALLDNPRGARAVGWALHALDADGDVPWHRVVGAGGRVTTRCDCHTPNLQRIRLEAEGVRFKSQDSLELADFTAILWMPSPFELESALFSGSSDDGA
jgi:methylated-DNA-protein-cysteine methyltransferase-like protein